MIKYWTTKDVSEKFGVSEVAIKKRVSTGFFPALRIRGELHFDDIMIEYMEKQFAQSRQYMLLRRGVRAYHKKKEGEQKCQNSTGLSKEAEKLFQQDEKQKIPG